ncbi:MAG TPA: RtcB family protein [Streptosporangiaceae bacterium]|nr:RtcB family protein [Streptosporangiaceae bacterium]
MPVRTPTSTSSAICDRTAHRQTAPVDADLDTVFEACTRTGTALEIGSSPDRLGLSAEHIRQARRHGVRFSIDSDAHAIRHLPYLRYGVGTAQRGRLTPGDGGVVSPGGVGFDISCGVRLLASDLDRDELASLIGQVMDTLAAVIPHGVSHGRLWQPGDRAEMEKILLTGARYAVERGHGVERDLERCEDNGAVADADTAHVSARAIDCGLHQVGSLGSGNHFLEVQAVEEIFDPPTAQQFGLRRRVTASDQTGT